MAAAAICRAAGLPEEDIFRVFPTLSPAGTLELLEARDGGMVFRDSAYRPRDLARALLALRSLTAGRLKVLFGSVGERAFFRRVPLSEAAAVFFLPPVPVFGGISFLSFCKGVSSKITGSFFFSVAVIVPSSFSDCFHFTQNKRKSQA